MKEEWLFPGAVVPVDMDTTLALVTEIKRLVNVIGGMALAQIPQEQEGPIADGWSINFSNGHSGLGVYAHLDEYPEEGAILLSGVPKWAIDAIKEVRAQPASPPSECKTEAEQTAYAFGWWKALESVRAEQPAQEPVAIVGVGGVTNEITVGWIQMPKHNDKLYTTPPKRERVLFPTMLRKMWSGGEVQSWLDENVNKEKNT
ncbi:hypothetical protein UFOVP48_33 [uncultured Caudovirales phage]|uniref:Uncharacterized protein n=1 Tax=uncultured Caudovirales phage TaxID=2100421 RepID=A0A6J5KQR0_9CAUD|nr:hypothetical protein UFOVP48_33 [uncultured Caudovirales phage]